MSAPTNHFSCLEWSLLWRLFLPTEMFIRFWPIKTRSVISLFFRFHFFLADSFFWRVLFYARDSCEPATLVGAYAAASGQLRWSRLRSGEYPPAGTLTFSWRSSACPGVISLLSSVEALRKLRTVLILKTLPFRLQIPTACAFDLPDEWRPSTESWTMN